MWKTIADGLLAFFGMAVLAAAPNLMAEGAFPLPGQEAPLFLGLDQDGVPWKLSDHVGKNIVFLYFYPKDDTPGCTSEACSMRDTMFDLKQADVEVVGVSFDDQDSHKKFIFKYNLDFTLLADTTGAIADAYGARVGASKASGSALFSAEEIKDLPGLIHRWEAKSDLASTLLWRSLSRPEQKLLKSYLPSTPSEKQVQEIVVATLNKVMAGPCIYKDKKLKGLKVRPASAELMKQNPKGRNLVLLNRLFLEDAFPLELARRPTMDRRVSFLIGLDGRIIQVTDSPDPAVHIKALAAAVAKLRGVATP